MQLVTLDTSRWRKKNQSDIIIPLLNFSMHGIKLKQMFISNKKLIAIQLWKKSGYKHDYIVSMFMCSPFATTPQYPLPTYSLPRLETSEHQWWLPKWRAVLLYSSTDGTPQCNSVQVRDIWWCSVDVPLCIVPLPPCTIYPWLYMPSCRAAHALWVPCWVDRLKKKKGRYNVHTITLLISLISHQCI